MTAFAEPSRLYSYQATNQPAGEVLDAVGRLLNRRLRSSWSSDPWLTKPFSLSFAGLCERDVVEAVAKAADRRAQRYDRFGYWVQPGGAEASMDTSMVDDWQVRLAGLTYRFRSELRPGSPEPPTVERVMAANWTLTPRDDLAMMSLANVELVALRYSDGSQPPEASRRLNVSQTPSGYALSLEFAAPPADADLRLAELRLALTFQPLSEAVASFELAGETVKPDKATIGPLQMAVEARGERWAVTIRPSEVRPAGLPRPADDAGASVARQLRNVASSGQFEAEARLYGAAGQPILTSNSVDRQTPGPGNWQLRLAVRPMGEERAGAAPPTPARLVVTHVRPGEAQARREVGWQDLPLPPRALKEPGDHDARR